MSTQQNVQLVKQICSAFEQSNISILLNLLADDIEWYVSGSSEYIPLAGTYHGRDQVLQIFTKVGEYLELDQFSAQDFVAENDQVVVFGYAQGRVKLTNRPLQYNWVHLYTLSDGKIIKFREYLNTAAIAIAFS